MFARDFLKVGIGWTMGCCLFCVRGQRQSGAGGDLMGSVTVAIQASLGDLVFRPPGQPCCPFVWRCLPAPLDGPASCVSVRRPRLLVGGRPPVCLPPTPRKTPGARQGLEGGEASAGSGIHFLAAILLLRGHAYEALENHARALGCYKAALRADPFCYEAFQAGQGCCGHWNGDEMLAGRWRVGMLPLGARADPGCTALDGCGGCQAPPSVFDVACARCACFTGTLLACRRWWRSTC
jgi:hypothetical protein